MILMEIVFHREKKLNLNRIRGSNVEQTEELASGLGQILESSLNQQTL